MPKKPDGLFVKRYVDQKSTSRTYHLYSNCGERGVKSEGVVFTPIDATVVGLFGLQVCKVCERRSLRVTFIDALALALENATDIPHDRDSITVAQEVVDALRSAGYDKIDLRVEQA